MTFFMAIILPGLAFSIADRFAHRRHLPSSEESTATQQTQETFPPEELTDMISVLSADGTSVSMELEEYLIGVLLGEMPMDFAMEALKSQAVVARTYTLRRNSTTPKHKGGAVCMESACCQSYCSAKNYIANGGTEPSVNKAIDAVAATRGQVLTYNGMLIEATYFSCSGGRTEDALSVWGTDIPYLQAVDSPGEENAVHYTDSLTFSAAEFENRLGLSLSGDPTEWFGNVTYTDGRGVEHMVIGGVAFKGTELRQKLGIRSTAFTVTPLENSVHITTKGFGHRVGMSQYGAEAMAVKGNTYRQILAHYYPGTTVTAYNRN
jgi:stage II sporulation protein D